MLTPRPVVGVRPLSLSLLSAAVLLALALPPGDSAAAGYSHSSQQPAMTAAADFASLLQKAEGGDPQAQCALALAYSTGRGVSEDPTTAVKWYRKAADQGYAKAQYGLGVLYETGLGVTQDDVQAAMWYRKAAVQGYAPAQYALGVLCARGQGVIKDEVEAFGWYSKAANQGHEQAQAALGLMADRGAPVATGTPQLESAATQWATGFAYATGTGVEQDATQAAVWYRKSAIRGFAKAQYGLGVLYETGLGVTQDDVQAAMWYRKAAVQGYAWAEFRLAALYGRGQGVRRDDAEAMVWYRKAADHGLLEAEVKLGDMYAAGLGVQKDDVRALSWYRKAAARGNGEAQDKVAKIYDEGVGAPEGDARADGWIRKAAEAGQAWAQYGVGVAYATGQGVRQDYAQAETWYRRSAEEQNYAWAQFALGTMYGTGLGVARDYDQAAMWFRKAASQGHALAQYNLAVLYTNGHGVSLDLVEAYALASSAAARSPSTTDRRRIAVFRDGLGQRLTINQIAEAKRRAQQWARTSQPESGESGVDTPSAPALAGRRSLPAGESIIRIGPADKNPSTNPDPFEQSAAAIVGLTGPRGLGTAFLISRGGLALTNHHVVVAQSALTATLRDGRQVAVRVLRTNADADVALIQIDCSNRCFTLSAAKLLPRVGTEVHVIGNPMSFEYTLTRGVVSGLRLDGGITLVQTDAAMNSGNSGGPIIDARSREVVAVVSWKVAGASAEGLGFGVAVADALRVLGVEWQ
jgi:TPR repeat protein